MALELWGKARSYLESSLAMSPRTDAFALYGRLLKQFGEEDNAALAFRSGLSLVTSAVEEMSALDGPDSISNSDVDAPMTDSSSEFIEVENVSNPTTR
jgi:HemY protein